MTVNSSRMSWPYPGRDDDPWYDGFRDLIQALDASGFASREDRGLILTGGGTVSWTLLTSTLAWSGIISIFSPLSAFLIQISPGSAVLADGQVLYVDLTRFPLENKSATAVVADKVPSTDNAYILAVRIGAYVFLRTGHSLSDGDSIPGFSPSPLADRSTATAFYIVGNAANGDSATVCHYLDTGDGVQLQAALTAAGTGKDVYIRPGTYNLGAGAATSPLLIPADVRVRGAGRRHTVIRTKAVGDQGAFVLGENALLEDVGIEVALSTGAGSGSTSVVAIRGDGASCHRVDVDFIGTWTLIEATFTALRSVFEIGTLLIAQANTQLVDCRVGADSQVPSWIDIGLAPGNELVLFSVLVGVSTPRVSAVLERCYGNGGDRSFVSYKPIRLVNSTFLNFYDRGAFLNGADTFGSEIADSHFEWEPTGVATLRAIVLDAAANVSVVDNYMVSDIPTPGQVGIELLTALNCTIRGNRGPSIPVAVSLDALSMSNVVIGNNFTGSIYTDLGVGNDVAHNM